MRVDWVQVATAVLRSVPARSSNAVFLCAQRILFEFDKTHLQLWRKLLHLWPGAGPGHNNDNEGLDKLHAAYYLPKLVRWATSARSYWSRDFVVDVGSSPSLPSLPTS